MNEALAIGWVIWLLIAVLAVTETAAIAALVRMFPEGRRWWTSPAQYLALAHFAACVLLNPWSRA